MNQKIIYEHLKYKTENEKLKIKLIEKENKINDFNFEISKREKNFLELVNDKEKISNNLFEEKVREINKKNVELLEILNNKENLINEKCLEIDKLNYKLSTLEDNFNIQYDTIKNKLFEKKKLLEEINVENLQIKRIMKIQNSEKKLNNKNEKFSKENIFYKELTNEVINIEKRNKLSLLKFKKKINCKY